MVLGLLPENPLSKSELANKIAHKKWRLLEKEPIELTIPDKPISHFQRYRITDNGRQVLNTLKEKRGI
jgi:hypothetical protein